jgi:hypothetical protein
MRTHFAIMSLWQRGHGRRPATTGNEPDLRTPRSNSHWIAQTADRVLAVMEESRSTWQTWHVRAEVQRQVRAADVPVERASALVDLLIDEVLDHRSVAPVPPPDGIDEPQALRRTDGSSVYTVAGADLYTSQRILDAERYLVIAAGRRDGAVVDESAVDLALLEMAANKRPWMLGRPRWSRRCAPRVPGCSSRSPRPAPGRPPPCMP